MAVEVWERGTDFDTFPATFTRTTYSATNWQEHLAPAGATGVEITNQDASTAYVSIGHDLTDGAAAAGDVAKAIPLAQGESYLVDLVGVDSQRFTESGLVPRTFFTCGDNLSLVFVSR